MSWRIVCFIVTYIAACSADREEQRLLENMFMNYNRLIRPAENSSEPVTVKLKLKLSQLLDVTEKSEILTTMVWLYQEWTDLRFVWHPEDYDGVDHLHIPADMIWTPHIVLYNNFQKHTQPHQQVLWELGKVECCALRCGALPSVATGSSENLYSADGNYEVSIVTKAIIKHDGTVIWEPPAMYNRAFYGVWDCPLVHFDQSEEKPVHTEPGSGKKYHRVERGIDINDLYPNTEWDVMAVPSERHEERYDCCRAPFIDISYTLSIRRKTLFYVVNLLIPCVAISFLTVLVFYLPSDSGEKVVLSISILISLTVFFLLLMEIIPSTSLVIPLIGLYLLFTMVVVCCSIVVTVISLNVHYRSPTMNRLRPWMRRVFIGWIPRLLCMTRVGDANETDSSPGARKKSSLGGIRGLVAQQQDQGNGDGAQSMAGSRASWTSTVRRTSSGSRARRLSFAFPQALQCSVPGRELLLLRDREMGDQPLRAAVDAALFIADHFKQQNDDDQIKEDWKYIAQVLDRLFLWIFSLTCLIGSGSIILTAPYFRDTRIPLVG